MHVRVHVHVHVHAHVRVYVYALFLFVSRSSARIQPFGSSPCLAQRPEKGMAHAGYCQTGRTDAPMTWFLGVGVGVDPLPGRGHDLRDSTTTTPLHPAPCWAESGKSLSLATHYTEDAPGNNRAPINRREIESIPPSPPRETF